MSQHHHSLVCCKATMNMPISWQYYYQNKFWNGQKIFLEASRQSAVISAYDNHAYNYKLLHAIQHFQIDSLQRITWWCTCTIIDEKTQKFSVTRMYFIGNLKIIFGLGANWNIKQTKWRLHMLKLLTSMNVGIDWTQALSRFG